MPTGFWGSHLGDHNGCKSMVETSVVSCESCSYVTCMWGTDGEINIIIAFIEWCVTGPFIPPLTRSLYVQYKLENIYVAINNICTTINNESQLFFKC